MSSITRYRVWPDGAVQEADTPAHHWKSDDYELVEAPTPEDAWARAKANASAVPQGEPLTSQEQQKEWADYFNRCDSYDLPDRRHAFLAGLSRGLKIAATARAPAPSKGAVGFGARALAAELAEAALKDDNDPEGHDISAGLFGPNVSAWLRKVASEYLAPAHAPAQEPAGEAVAAALGDIIAMWDQHVPSEYVTPLHMQAKRALEGQQPVSPDMHGWCAYVGGMVAHWIRSEPDAFIQIGEERFEAAIAGIIERRLWAMPKDNKPTSAPKPAQEQCNACLGTGRMVRDPDIGTDQECFVCDGSGYEPEQEVGLTDELEQLGHIANGIRICGVHDKRFVAQRIDDIIAALRAKGGK